jgi:hypothetical protein
MRTRSLVRRAPPLLWLMLQLLAACARVASAPAIPAPSRLKGDFRSTLAYQSYKFMIWSGQAMAGRWLVDDSAGSHCGIIDSLTQGWGTRVIGHVFLTA